MEETKRYYGSKREMVVSDSTLVRSLSTIHLDPLRSMLWKMAREALKRERAKLRLPSGREIALGIVDGTQFGDDVGSVMILAGDRTDTVAGYAMSPGRGHELATSRGVKAEALRTLGSGCVDMIAGDGLYMNEEDLRWCLEKGGCHGLVKTSEETLDVIQDAKAILAQPAFFEGGIEKARGVDEKRGVRYVVKVVRGFSWRGMKLTVARVREIALKPKGNRPEESAFWIITTDETLSAEDLREIAHRRWHIENRTFRRLSALVDSKRRLTKDRHVREALLGLWFIGLNLLGLFWSWMRPEGMPAIYRTAKKTWKWLGRLFERETIVGFETISP